MTFEHETDKITVWNDTVKYWNERLGDINEDVLIQTKNSVKFTALPKLVLPECSNAKDMISHKPYRCMKRFLTTTVKIIKRDMIYEAIDYKLAGFSPLMLNMADWVRAGGCVSIGSSAQEEECFRRSNYFLTLLQDLYPLGPLDTILSPQVEYFRNGVDKGYTEMEPHHKIDMVASPAPCYPVLDRESGNQLFAKQEDVLLLENKIRMLFYVAEQNGNDVLILSAWECGVFGCPAYHVAKIFKKIIAENQGGVKEVVFAILGPSYEKFMEIFNGTL